MEELCYENAQSESDSVMNPVPIFKWNSSIMKMLRVNLIVAWIPHLYMFSEL